MGGGDGCGGGKGVVEDRALFIIKIMSEQVLALCFFIKQNKARVQFRTSLAKKLEKPHVIHLLYLLVARI